MANFYIRPPFVLENVDRLKSPSKQRGRDFGVMLRCLDDLGYAVEWRVINAADYGFAQRRRRVFIFAYHKSTNHYNQIINSSSEDIILKKGIFADECDNVKEFRVADIRPEIYKDLVDVSDKFEFQFLSSGIMVEGIAFSANTEPITKKYKTLGQVLERNVAEKILY